MKYRSEFDSAHGICIVRVKGKFCRPYDSDELKHFAVDYFTEHGCHLFLIDMRETEVIGGTMQVFKAANPQGELAQSLRMIRTAFVRRKLTHSDLFYEDVAINRGFQLRAFDALDKAVEWLKKNDGAV